MIVGQTPGLPDPPLVGTCTLFGVSLLPSPGYDIDESCLQSYEDYVLGQLPPQQPDDAEAPPGNSTGGP